MNEEKLYLKFKLAANVRDREKIFSLRYTAYNKEMKYLLNSEEGNHPAEDKFDSYSYLFYCQNKDRTIATCRWTPRFLGYWELTSLCSEYSLPVTNSDQLIESSRLLVSPHIRNRGVAEAMVYFSCLWLSKYTNFTSYFAVCSPLLVPFYRHFGLKILSPQEVSLKGRENRKYLVVYGDVRESTKLLYDYLTQKRWYLSFKYAILPYELNN